MQNSEQKRPPDGEAPLTLSTQWKLAILVGCTLTFLWLVLGMAARYAYERTLAEAQKDAENLVRVFSEEANSTVRALDLTLLDLRDHWEANPASFPDKVRKRQSNLARRVAFQVSVLDAGGRLVYSSNDPKAAPIDLSDREHFRAHLDGGDNLFVSAPVLGRVSKRWSVQFTRPVFDGQGRFGGVMVLSVDPEYFVRFSRMIDLGPAGTVTLMRPSGQLLARSPTPHGGLNQVLRNLPQVPPPSEANSVTSVFRVSQVDGIERLYSWRQLPAYPLVVSVGRSKESLVAAYYRQRNMLHFGGAAMSLAIILIGYVVFAGMQQRKQARIALEQSEQRWRYALEGASEVLWDWDIVTGELYFSSRLEQILGYGIRELGNRIETWIGLVHPDEHAAVTAALEAHFSGEAENFASELRMRCKDGSWRWVFSRGTVVSRDAGGKALRITGALADISERKRAEEAEREYRSNYDALTGLANRQLLREQGVKAIDKASGIGGHVWVICINLDRFKVVNDALGHQAGDAVLQMMARRLQSALRTGDIAARVAGDEYVVMLSEVSDEHTVTTAVQRMREALAAPLTIEGQEYTFGCTAGIAVYPSDGETADCLMLNAEIAMRRAKTFGRNSFQFYTAAMNERAIDRLRIENDLRCALAHGELRLHYQPQVEMRTGRLAGVEALLRWQHPQLGMVPPDRFIRIAEETGVILEIGAWVMEEACMQARRWHEAGHEHLRVSVNLSVNQFHQPDLIDSVAAVLERSGLPGGALDIELTESVIMVDVDAALNTLHGLKRLGVTLSLDDFGTGHSSLSYLKRLPIDALKIDKSFVRNITTDPQEAAIARSIIALAHSLQLRVVAEGVETEHQLAYLRRHRCDSIQGYYYSRALPAPELELLMAEDRRIAHQELSEKPRQTLLIVDDEENVTAALVRLLRRDGYHILRASSGEEGLAQLALHDVQVVLSDQRMPGMSGSEFLSKVKSLYPDTIRIMLSGYTGVDSIIDATNSGAVFRFHAKPWDDERLRASIAEAFRYHWLVRRAESVAA
ncbi:EAL domain-containing protein [Massilia endophytica]|uniref:EAL domain-containing protein n=1 Tax=Massilia endophytica TaxID=2899220 RepID=UPI001E549A9C|nr:EAL domain-containing protein [Massilia endophytica]UGQ48759.1 EAL domain-containing protein [Massilia endophytica]